MIRTFILATAICCPLAAPAQADDRIIQFMEDRYTHGLLHQLGPEATGEPKALGRADCTGLRALSRSQRNEVRALGRVFERSGVHIDLLATSRWCQAIETAQLLELRPVTEEPVLNALDETSEDGADAILDLLDGQRPSETALLVTHASNIRALTGRDSQPGEVLVIRLKPGADLELLGSFVPD